ncbi:MAG: TraB/VirB10 family protein, partial [Desulfobacterales bacterium]
MKKLKEIFKNLKGRDKGKIVKTGIGLALAVLVMAAYAAVKNKDSRIATRADAKQSALKFDERTFEKTIYNKTRAEVEGIRQDLDTFKKEMRNLLSSKIQELEKKERYGETQSGGKDNTHPVFPGKTGGKQTDAKFPIKNQSLTGPSPLPLIKKSDLKEVPVPQKSPFKKSQRSRGGSQGAIEETPIKQIAVFDNPNAAISDAADPEDILVHLPPSFMEANLLNGVTAPATDVGRSNPIPMLIRVNNLAVLPNNVKSNTKGCFVVAEGYGSLADERVHARLLTISCINQKGGTVIDQKIKGFVVDTDGKEGMKGHVYAKFGQNIARVAIAGFLEGLGEAMALGQQEFTYGANTGVRSSQFTNTDPDTLAMAGIGQGIVNVAEDLQN